MAKKCRFIGFRLLVDTSFPRDPVINGLLSLDSKVIEYKKRPQHFTVARIGEYVCGRLVTLKPNTARLIADTESLETILDSVPEGMSEVSFNYFILHARTLHGLYAYYPGSVPFADFGTRFQGISRRSIRPVRAAAVEAAKKKADAARKKDVPKAELDRIDQVHAVSFHPLLRRETMDKVIAEWQQVRGVRYHLSTTRVDADQYEAIGQYTKASVHELRLEPNVPTRTYGAKITTFLFSLKQKFGDALKRTTLFGTNEVGEPQRVNLGKITDSFASVGMQLLHKEAEAKGVKLTKSQMILAMIAEAEDRPDYFGQVQL